MARIKPDFHDSRTCTIEERERLEKEEITPPDIKNKPRLKLGKATFFYKTEKQKAQSIVHEWIRRDPLRLKTTNFTD